MRPLSVLRPALLLAALALAASGPARAQGEANQNGGFEGTAPGVVTDLGNGVQGWILDTSLSPPPEFAVVEDVVHTGQRALRVTVRGVGQNVYDVQAIGAPVRVEPGKDYRYSVWARVGSGTGTANFTVGNAAFNEYGRLDQQELTDQWQEFAFTFTVTDGETEIRAPIHFSFQANLGDAVYIDDLRVTPLAPPDLPDAPIAQGKSKFLGNIYSAAQRPGFEAYWNQVTPENAGKWGLVERQRDVMFWDDLDAAYALAKDNGFPFHFHTLVWGRTQPEWIQGLPESEQREEIEEWFQAVADRYPDIDYLEVVNEPLHDPPVADGSPDGGAYIGALGGTGETGFDWVITAFELARDIFPEGTPLMLNDYNILSSTAEAQSYIEIINLLKDRGLIGTVGIQGHAFSTRPGAPIQEVMDLVGATGVPVQITELDIDGNPNRIPTLSDAFSDRNQLQAFQRVFPVLWEHPAVEGITLWGWRVGHWRTEEDAFLIRPDGQERPALVWLREYVQQTTVDAEPGVAQSGLTLFASRPNPVRGASEIRFALAEPTDVTLAVYDALGRRVRVLASGPYGAGEHPVAFSAAGLPAGVYLYRLTAGAAQQTQRLVVVD